jgi:hypothetical protein
MWIFPYKSCCKRTSKVVVGGGGGEWEKLKLGSGRNPHSTWWESSKYWEGCGGPRKKEPAAWIHITGAKKECASDTMGIQALFPSHQLPVKPSVSVQTGLEDKLHKVDGYEMQGSHSNNQCEYILHVSLHCSSFSFPKKYMSNKIITITTATRAYVYNILR